MEEHWQRITAAVRGSQMAAVWYEYKRGGVRQPSAINPQGPAVHGGDEPAHLNAEYLEHERNRIG